MSGKVHKIITGVKALYCLNVKRNPRGFLPPTLVIMLSDRCNYRCITCNCYEIGDKEKELSTQEWFSVIDDFKNMGGISVRFTGGEAFLRRKTMYALIDRLNGYGINVKISTNGSLIRDRDIEELKKREIGLVEISLHGRKENHEGYVGINGIWQKTIDVIEKLKEIGIEVRIAFTIIKSNIGDIPYIVELSEKLGITVSFNILDGSAYYFQDLDSSIFPSDDDMKMASESLVSAVKEYPEVVNGSIKDFEKAPDVYKDSRMEEYYCARVLMNSYIDSFGNVYHGCWAMPSIGSLKEKSYEAILNSEEYENGRKKGFEKECPGCTCAYQMDMAMGYVKRPVVSKD